jgi:hypothetical protein
MLPILLRRPSLALSAVAAFAVAAAIAAPALERTVWALLHGARFLPSAPAGAFGSGGVLLIAVVLFLAGVVSGLAGFAFSAVAACVLWLLPPLQAMPLIMLLSASNQLLSIGKLRRDMALMGTAEREGALPYILGGFAGVPIGVALLRGLPANWFAAGLGLFLIVYSGIMLALRRRARIGLSGWKNAVAVGAVGGVVGGFSGFGASALVVYLGLRDADKAAVRGITQPFILAMQLASLALLAVLDPTIFDAGFWLLWATTLPAVLLGTSTGVALYRRLSDGNFRRSVLILLGLSGFSLIAKAMF